MSAPIPLTLFCFAWGDFDLLLEDGGTFRVSTLPRANLPIAAIAIGNFDLVIVGGTTLPVTTDVNNIGPDNANQLFAYNGGAYNVCKASGGTETIVPNNIT
jgi:hypothetical protein